ncbi:MAG: DUF4011 domain-containing protein [Muribaculaceae bacterium]|nr:DUF4011 domain-containing protein [Muribaculaceae bacterium]
MEDINKVRITADYLKISNYALFHNRIPICQSVEVTNVSEETLENVTVSCSGEFVDTYESTPIGRINPGETVRIIPFCINPNPKPLASITERASTSFRLTAKSNDEIIGEASFELELMPYDHWTGTGILPQTIASFITPNNPAIDSLTLKSAAILKSISGSSSFKAYQAGNTADVRQQVAAVFAGIHETGIIYREMAASYEDAGQRITMPDQVIASKIGNCLELTLLMASVLEAIGINCLIIFQKGHAYLGVWLVDDCYPCSVSDDPAFIEKNCAQGIDEMLVLECTMATQEKASFEEAMKIAAHNLADHDKFEIFIDVKRSRLERIRPLPTRIENVGSLTLETEGIEHDRCILDVKEHDRYDLSHIAANGKNLTKFDIWERKLLDFSLRNTLLNLSLRRRAIQFISFDINRVEDHLQDGNEYRITSKPNVEIHFGAVDHLLRSKIHEELHELISNDIEHQLLHTFLPENETKNVLKNIYRAARNAIEESGANSLFLAIGALRWYETEQSTTPRYAPLLLLPVEMVYKKGNYYIRTRDEEISLNITLMEFLRQNFDINISGLNPLPLDSSGVDVPLIFAIIRDALRGQKRWDVEEECLLGIFSFSKFLMWNDVHNHREELSQNNIISSLVANRLTWTQDSSAPDLNEIDRNSSPAEIALPVDVDSSQMAAIIEAAAGNSFILYGPPGTGKSQTITNLIANALYHGKRVLFVAEKMAALSVVQSRLEKIGLDAFCLELHSNKSTKRHVLQQLEKALKVVHIAAPGNFANQADKIFERRKQLLTYIDALHTPDKADGLSLYDCIIRAESIKSDPIPGFKYDRAIDSLISTEGIDGIDELLGSRLQTVVRLVGQPSKHPLKGLRIEREMLMETEKTASEMKIDSEVMSNYQKESDQLRGAKHLREKLMRDNNATIFDEDPEELRQEWRRAKAKWFIPRFFAKRSFIKKLKQHNPLIIADEVDALVDDLLTYRQKHLRIAEFNRIIKNRFNTEYGTDEVPESSYLGQKSALLAKWADNSSKMRDWLHWNELSDDLKKSGMGCVADALEAEEIAAESIKGSFLKALFIHKAEEKIAKSEELAAFEGMLFDEKIATYRKLTEEFKQLTRKELYARLASRVPRMADNATVGNGSETGLLNRNISNGGRGLSLRDLFDQLPTLLPRLCPCMLMSPISVAQYIDIGADKFDLVVFDEASQMPTSESVGAIARGKALIVVGDPKQMPPTSFFSSTNVDTEEASIDDMESILEDCRTLDMPSLQLSWHYRSRHESLIAFSNNEYYEGSLITFPSSDDKATKVHFIPVKGGYYEKGGRRCNQVEAEAIVDEIERRLRNARLRTHSIGVIAFSVMQQGLIEDILQERLEQDKNLSEAASGMYEPIFVKNLENVQGDERDVILFSIGYGPDKDGKVSMNFGPLNNAGGERRLNVAVSRARQEMYVFSTLKSADIDLRRSKAKGVEGLKHFLEYAETKTLPTLSQAKTDHSHSVIAEEIASELRKHGFQAITNVGRSKFRVDVAIEKNGSPGRFSLGILLDGHNYRDTNTTRDREVVQPSVLRGLNWKVMRVWSVDWFRNKERVVNRIIEKLSEAETEKTEENEIPVFDITKEKAEEKNTNAKKYIHYLIDSSEAEEVSDLELMHKIIATEQPITFMNLCRRMSSLRGGRVTPSLQKSLGALTGNFFTDSSGALWINDQDCLDCKFYRPDSGRDISDIPEAEIINSIIETLNEQVALNQDELTMIASKKMGFTRRGTNVDAAFKKALETMKRDGKIERIGENIRFSMSKE